MKYLALAILLLPSLAGADIQKNGPEAWPGRTELSAHIGFQQGITSYFDGGTPSGFKFFADYAYRVQKLLWLDVGVDLVFGAGQCDLLQNCSYGGGGYTVDPHAGIKVKWLPPIPLVPYAKVAVEGIINYHRFCDDGGFALAGRISGGAKYFLLRNLGVGIETGFNAGPGFYNGTDCAGFNQKSHVEFYFAFDFGVGAEFIF